ncbi:MAG: squalene synthase HpnC [Planctomycetaceae bacterium]
MGQGRYDIQTDLRRFGPESGWGGCGPAEAAAYCRGVALGHYENFPVVSLLLPRAMRDDFYAVYAWCRWADDLGDELGDRARSQELLAWWREATRASRDGGARHPVLVALAQTVARHQIPQEPFDDLVSAFLQDQVLLEYATRAELLDYCRRSANPVGRLVLFLCGRATAANFAWSDSICTGLQLANFWQDVGRDHTLGRCYLPEEDRARFGYTRAQWVAREETPAFLQLLEHQVAEARRMLSPWSPGREPELRQFPWRVQVDLEMFARGGERILERIAGIGYRVFSQRPVVTGRDAVGLLGRCVGHAAVRAWRGSRHAAQGD